MNGSGGRIKAAACALALASVLAPALLAAQSVNDYRLPGATASPSPSRAQGPVDSDAPVVRGPQPSAAPSAEPSAAPASGAASSPAPGSIPVIASPRPGAPTPPRRPAATSSVRPGLAPPPIPVTTPSAGPALPTGVPGGPAAETGAPLPGGTPAAQASSNAADSAALPDWWPWAAGGAIGVAFGLLLAMLLRRRAERALPVAFEPPVVHEPAPQAAPEPVQALRAEAAEPLPEQATTAPPVAEPAPAPAPAARPAAAANPQGLTIALEARRMSASLMATTLSYRLMVTNHGSQPLSALAVEGDMVSAHASLPPDQQMANGGQRLELRHALVALAPGESAEFTGDFRLPLAAVTPIRSGDAAYFVPLARLRVEAATPNGQPLICAQTFVVGEQPETPGGALRPFRLDLGPRTYSRIGQRAVS
ncbi:MAG: hypothetical protein ABL926_08230 [Novosphingobium sp.]|uniref:hypothetical protein n=1 Tax=Novosphingobium sp. TaxID=1874826 RepID=UPI0032B781B5